MAKFRRATFGDMPALVRYGKLFWQHTRWAQDGWEFNETSVRDMIQNLLEGLGFIIVVTDEEDNVKGFGLVMEYLNSWNSDISCAGELAYYIDEQYRGGGTGKKLLRLMETIARSRGVKYMAMISMAHSMDVGPLYKRMGYVETETTYTKEL